MIRVGILTVSDRSSRGEREVLSGPALKTLVQEQGWEVSVSSIVPDNLEVIKSTLISWVDFEKLDLVLTTGGTGFAQRDITPEATLEIIDRNAPGIAEAMRAQSLKITDHAMLSRAIAGIRKTTLIVNFPGSPKAATENFAVIQSVIPHAIQLLKDDPAAEGSHQI